MFIILRASSHQNIPYQIIDLYNFNYIHYKPKGAITPCPGVYWNSTLK